MEIKMASHVSNTLEGNDLINYKLMVPKLKRRCLSATSAQSGKPNVEDVPLGAKLPLVPGNNMVLRTAGLGEKLHQPSCGFDLRFPKEEYISNDYRCFHDYHLKRYYLIRPLIVEKMKGLGMITPDYKVSCTLKEYNLYRQYLKQLSIEFLNKICQEEYRKELFKKKLLFTSSIEKKKKDPFNPITVRINRALQVRTMIDKIRILKGKKLMKLVAREKALRLQEKNEDMERRIKREKAREYEREKMKKLKEEQKRKEYVLREEVLFFKHQEDVFRSKQLEEKRKISFMEKQRKIIEKYERKRKFHFTKMEELRWLTEEEAEKRREKVKMWKDYFDNKLGWHERKFKQVLERDRRRRAIANRRVAKSLYKRGWRASNFGFPGRRQPPPDLCTRKIFSELGFHNAIADDDIFLSDDDLSGGDAVTEDQEGLELRKRMTTKANLVAIDAMEISKSVLFPLLQTYESRTRTHVHDTEVQPLLHEICPSIFRENLRSEQNSLDSDAITEESIFNKLTRLLDDRRRLAFNQLAVQDRDEPIIHESGNVLERTIKDLASKVAGQVLPQAATSNELKDIQEKIGSRIAMLASSVVNDILAVGVRNSAQFETHPCAADELESNQSTESSSIETMIERKLSLLAKTMVDDMLEEQVSDSAKEDESSNSGLSDLARHVARSALDTILIADETTGATESQVVESIAAKINELSSTMLTEIMETKGQSKVDKRHGKAKKENYAKLENKISKLALSVVGSIFQNNITSHSHSNMTESSISSEAKAPGTNIDDFLNAIFQLKPKSDTSKQTVRRMEEKEIERISRTIANKISPPCHDSPTVMSGIHHLVAALADDLVARRSIEPERSTSIGLAVKYLADAVVGKTLKDYQVLKKKTTKHYDKEISSSESSSLGSAVSDLADTLITSTIKKLKSGQSTEKKKPELVSESEQSSEECSSHDEAIEGASRLFSSLLSGLVEEFAKLSSSEEKSSTESSDLESVLSSAVSLIVVDVIASKVVERIQQRVTSLNPTEVMQLKEEVQGVVFGLFESQKKKSEKDGKHAGTKSHSNPSSLLSSSDRSTINSAAGALAESILQRLLDNQQTKLDTVPENEDAINSIDDLETPAQNASISAAINLLHSDFGRLSLKQKGICELEAALNAAASQVVTEAISNKVLERIEEQAITRLSDVDSSQLKQEVREIVSDLIDTHESSSNASHQTSKAKGAIPWSSSDQSTMSSATSAIAENLMHQILGHLSVNSSGTLQLSEHSSIVSATSALAEHVTMQVVEKFTRKNEFSETTSKSKSSKQTHLGDHDDNRRYKSDGNNNIAAPMNATTLQNKIKGYNKKGRKGQYRSSFISWKDQLLHPITSEKSKRGRRVDRVKQLPTEDKKVNKESQPILENIASQIVQSVADQQTEKLDGKTIESELRNSNSSHSLVENLALGVVSSLLGLDNDKVSASVSNTSVAEKSFLPAVPPPSAGLIRRDPLSSKKTISSISLGISSCSSSKFSQTHLSQEQNNELPLATYNLVSALVRPPAAIPRMRTLKFTDDKKYQRLSRLLNAPSDYSRDEFMNSCEDNATDHPHRVPSPLHATHRKVGKANKQQIKPGQHNRSVLLQIQLSLKAVFIGSSQKNEKTVKPIHAQEKKCRISVTESISQRNSLLRHKTSEDAFRF